MEVALDSDQALKQRAALNSMRLNGECCDARVISASDFKGDDSFSLGVHCCVMCSVSPVLHKKYSEVQGMHIKKDCKSRIIILAPGVSKEVWFLVLDFVYLGKVTFEESCSFDVIAAFISLINSLKIVEESEFDKFKKQFVHHPGYEDFVKNSEESEEILDKVVTVYMGPDEPSLEKSRERKLTLRARPEPKPTETANNPKIKEYTESELLLEYCLKEEVQARKAQKKKKPTNAPNITVLFPEKPKEFVRHHKCNDCGKSFFMHETLQKHVCPKTTVVPQRLIVNSKGAFVSPAKESDTEEHTNPEVKKIVCYPSDSDFADSDAGDVNEASNEEINSSIVAIKEEPRDDQYLETTDTPSLNMETFHENNTSFEGTCAPIKIEPIEGYSATEPGSNFLHNPSSTMKDRADISGIEGALYPSMENINILLEEHRQIAREDHEDSEDASEVPGLTSSVLNVIDSIDGYVKKSPRSSGFEDDQEAADSPTLDVIESIGDTQETLKTSPCGSKIGRNTGKILSQKGDMTKNKRTSVAAALEDQKLIQNETVEQVPLSFKGQKGMKKTLVPGKGASYNCVLCGRKFFMFVSLVLHQCKMDQTKEEKFYKCSCCDKYVRSSEVREHIFPMGEVKSLTEKDLPKIKLGKHTIVSPASEKSVTDTKKKLRSHSVKPGVKTNGQLIKSSEGSSAKTPENVQQMSSPVKKQESVEKLGHLASTKSKPVTSEELFAQLERSVETASFPMTQITVVTPKDKSPSEKQGSGSGDSKTVTNSPVTRSSVTKSLSFSGAPNTTKRSEQIDSKNVSQYNSMSSSSSSSSSSSASSWESESPPSSPESSNQAPRRVTRRDALVNKRKASEAGAVQQKVTKYQE